VLVAVDSNLIDLFKEACCSAEHLDAIEATGPPPRFKDMPAQQEAEVFACYWLLAMASAWRSTVYTFSDTLYQEVARAPTSGSLLRIAFDVLAREDQAVEHRQPDPTRRPPESELRTLRVKGADVTHIADAVGLGCQYFLTNDRQLRNRSVDLEARWHLKVRRPSEFLVEAVRSGAPWTTQAPWPWESLNRIV
jgi:hypothetical protein